MLHGPACFPIMLFICQYMKHFYVCLCLFCTMWLTASISERLKVNARTAVHGVELEQLLCFAQIQTTDLQSKMLITLLPPLSLACVCMLMVILGVVIFMFPQITIMARLWFLVEVIKATKTAFIIFHISPASFYLIRIKFPPHYTHQRSVL